MFEYLLELRQALEHEAAPGNPQAVMLEVLAVCAAAEVLGMLD